MVCKLARDGCTVHCVYLKEVAVLHSAYYLRLAARYIVYVYPGYLCVFPHLRISKDYRKKV
jgi:hypothetical protein